MRVRRFSAFLSATAAAAILAVPACAQTNPYLQSDDSWISIDGTVDEVWEDAFELDYGEGTVTVEMDDGDRDADAYILNRGDKVSVSGRVDDDLFERTTIEAGRVYVEQLGTHFYSSAADEEDWYASIDPPVEVSSAEIRGVVTAVGKDELTLRTGTRDLRVETHSMAYDPLDDEGYQKIEAGDYVSVTGDLERGFFEGQRIVAEDIITLLAGTS